MYFFTIYWKTELYISIFCIKGQLVSKQENSSVPQVHRQRTICTMNSQGNMGAQKESKISPETKLKIIEDCNLNDR